MDETASSTSKIVYDLLKDLNSNISKEMALALMCGIMTDTAHLKFAKLDDLKTIVELLEKQGLNFSDVLKLLSISPDISEQ